MEDAKGITRKYHATMAKFHGGRGGVKLDDAGEDSARTAYLDYFHKIAATVSFDEWKPKWEAWKARGKTGRVLDSILADDAGMTVEALNAIYSRAAELANSKPMYDSVQAGITTLEIALGVVTTNEPINRAAGNIEQADLEARNALEFSEALTLLRAHGRVLDDATGGLFGDGDSGYIMGTISRNGVPLATVHLAEGVQRWQPLPEAQRLMAAGGEDNANVTELADTFEFGSGDYGDVLKALSELAADVEESAAEAIEQMAAEQKAREEREAMMKASEEARAAALQQAREFGQAKPGFVGAIADAGGDAIKAALARKPLGSFIFVVARQSAGAGQPDTFGFVVWSRQTIGKRGRINDPEGGKPGNALASRMMDAPAEAYEQAVANIRKIGGVLLAGQAEPAALTGGSEDPTAGDWVANYEGSTKGGLYFKDVGQARDWIDGQYEANPGRLYWMSHLKSTEFRLPFGVMTAIKKNEGTAYPGSEAEIQPFLEKAQRFANKEIGQYGADWMRQNLGLLLAYFSGQSLAWANRYVASKFPTEAEQLAKIEAAKQPPAAAEPAELATLREIIAGQHDSLPIADMLDKLTKATEALEAAGLLTGDAEALANQAIMKWAELEQQANG